ncbi:hypothetical protein ACRAKJ_19930 [Saccharothrix sp. DSM 118769]
MDSLLPGEDGPRWVDKTTDLLSGAAMPGAHLAGWARSQAPALVALVEDDETGRRHRVLGWALDHGDRVEVLIAGVHTSGASLDSVVTAVDPRGRLRTVTVYDPGRTGAGAVAAGRPDLSLPLGPQLSGRSRVDAFRLACLAELKAQAATGITPGELAARHALTPRRLEVLLREADLTLHTDRPIGPQIRSLPLAHPVRRQGEAILAGEFLTCEHPDAVKRRHDVSTHILYGAVRRYCDGRLVAGMPLGPQLRVHRPGSAAWLLAVRVLAREHADDGADAVRRRHLLNPRRLDTVLAWTLDNQLDAPDEGRS